MKYVVKEGDSLSKIAEAQFGHMDDWEKLWKDNKDVIGKNPNKIYPGMELDIPFDLKTFISNLITLKVK